MKALRTGSLLVTTIALGLGAGVFALFSHTVMPALAGMDDRTFVGVFQGLDRSILNPWFLGFSFVGPLVFAVVALAAIRRGPAVRWVGLGLVLHVAVVVITMAVNVPLNEALGAAGPPDRVPDPAAVRAAFDEARWQGWNLTRTLLDVAAFGCLGYALVLHGRATAA